MRKNVYFYLPENTINEATDYYVKLIESVFLSKGFNIFRCTKKQEVMDDGVLVTIRPGDQKHFKKRENSIFINWFQGIGPEEYYMLHGKSVKSWLVNRILILQEKKSLNRSNLCIFVSEKMREHYERKYNLRLRDKSIIIPCYNKKIEKKYFIQSKYDKLNFVYAGGLFNWQCIDETLLIFKEIYRLDNSATLTLLTSQINEAKELIKKYGLKNINIDYVKLDKLQERLSDFKYGFLVRKDNIVNNVATPTKMNSYLAAGLVPIYTDVIDAFEKNIKIGDYSVKLSLPLDYKEAAKKIVEHHKHNINSEYLYDKYNEIFDKYYNDDLYKKNLELIIEKL